MRCGCATWRFATGWLGLVQQRLGQPIGEVLVVLASSVISRGAHSGMFNCEATVHCTARCWRNA